MSEQVGQFGCPACGQVFTDATIFSDHVKAHQVSEFQTGPAEEFDIERAYAHADEEFRRSRVPLFGIALFFLLAFVYSVAFRVAIFAPLFVAATASMILAAAFLFKDLMEG